MDLTTRLNRTIYSDAGVQEAIEAYRMICSIAKVTRGEYHELRFKDVDDAQAESLLNEFHNYVLYSSIASQKTW